MKLKRSWIPTLAVALIALVTGGWLLQQSGGGANDTFFKAQLFDQVRELVADHYVEDVDQADLYQMALEGMLHELGDPYTSYLDKEQWKQLRLSTTGNYGGLGIRIDSQDGWITVVGVLPETPAEREGLQAGDRIIEVEGESAEGWSTTRAVNVLRGEKGTEVTITVARVGMDKPLRFDIERDEVHIVAVRSFMLDDGVGYVKLDPFSRDARRDLQQAIDGLRSEGASSIVLDLRGNPGGLLDEGVAVSDLFLPEGSEVVTTGSRGRAASEVFRAPEAEAYPDMPLVVLVDGYSASASEIVAGALQDHDRALLVGTTTFGKGSVQSLFNLPGGNYLKMTTGRWYTPTGRSIQKPHDRESQISQLASQAVAMGGAPVRVSSADTSSREKFTTDGGRTVYGGGGITPDLIVVPDTLSTREQLFRSTLAQQGVTLQTAAFQFAVQWVKDHPEVGRDFEVTPEMREAFYRHLTEELGEDLSRRLYEDARKLVDLRIGMKIAGARWGATAELQHRIGLDRQLDRAASLLRRAGGPGELFALASETGEGAGGGPAGTGGTR